MNDKAEEILKRLGAELTPERARLVREALDAACGDQRLERMESAIDALLAKADAAPPRLEAPRGPLERDGETVVAAYFVFRRLSVTYRNMQSRAPATAREQLLASALQRFFQGAFSAMEDYGRLFEFIELGRILLDVGRER